MRVGNAPPRYDLQNEAGFRRQVEQEISRINSRWAQPIAGYGTTTNGVRIANYNASTATATQTQQLLAQLISDLQAFGVLAP